MTTPVGGMIVDSWGRGHSLPKLNLGSSNPPASAILHSDARSGTAQRALDMTATPLNSVQAGDTRYFQFWYRVPGVIGARYNLTGGLEVTFSD